MLVVLDLVEQTGGLEGRNDAVARFSAVEAAVFLGHGVVQNAMFVEDIDRLKPMSTADLKIVEIVGRCDLDRTGAFLWIGIGIAYDRNQAPDQR